MKMLTQLFLLIGGLLGLLVSLPAAIVGWKIHKGFAGDLTYHDYPMLFGPLLCVVAMVAGDLWIRNDKKHEPKRRPGKLTEDGGGGGF